MKAITQETVGLLRYKESIPYSPEMFASIFNMNIDIIKGALTIFEKLKMIELKDDGSIWIEEANKLVGSETDKAEKMRKLRAKRRGVTMLPDVNQSKSIEKDIDIELECSDNPESVQMYNKCNDKRTPPPKDFIKINDIGGIVIDKVKLTQEEYCKLLNDFNEDVIDKYIVRMQTYCNNKKKSYAECGQTIRKWLLEDGYKPKKSYEEIKKEIEVEEKNKLLKRVVDL